MRNAQVRLHYTRFCISFQVSRVVWDSHLRLFALGQAATSVVSAASTVSLTNHENKAEQGTGTVFQVCDLVSMHYCLRINRHIYLKPQVQFYLSILIADSGNLCKY